MWVGRGRHLRPLTRPRLWGRVGGGRTGGAGPRVTSKTPYQPHWHSSDRVMPAPILALTDLPARLPPRGALIGLDLGTKTIGVATSDPDRRLATGVETVVRTNFSADARRLLALALPVNMDGSEGPRAQSTRSFARNFARLTELPIAFWDERLSTAAVERELIAANARRDKRKAVIDEHAAIFILQGALDRLRNVGKS